MAEFKKCCCAGCKRARWGLSGYQPCAKSALKSEKIAPPPKNR